MHRTQYQVEGKRLFWPEIRARVPAYVKDCTLRLRLIVYRYDTWEMLCSEPNKRRRPRRQVVKTQPAKVYRPAFTGEWA